MCEHMDRGRMCEHTDRGSMCESGQLEHAGVMWKGDTIGSQGLPLIKGFTKDSGKSTVTCMT